MDIQLQGLIEKIKKDGIESASEDAARIRSQAEAEAKRIVDDAKKTADGIIEAGKADAERSEKAGVAAVEQASRNLVLAFKTEIQSVLDRIVEKNTIAAFNTDTLKAVIPDVVKAMASEKGGVDVILSESQLGSLDSWAKGALSSELSGGLELKVGKIGAGFRIAEKDGSAYYDFSAQAVAEALSAYLNPKLAETLKSAVKGI